MDQEGAVIMDNLFSHYVWVSLEFSLVLFCLSLLSSHNLVIGFNAANHFQQTRVNKHVKC